MRAAGRRGAGLLVLVGLVLVARHDAVAQDAPVAAEMQLPEVVLTDVPFDVTLTLPVGHSLPATARYRVFAADTGGGLHGGEGTVALRGDDGALAEVKLEGLSMSATGARRVRVEVDGLEPLERDVRVLPAWLSLLPPLLAIALALAVRQVVLALVAGVWLGAFFISGYRPLIGLLRTADTYAAGALGDTDHAQIIVFSMLLGGMIGVITRSGGGLGLANLVTRFARTSRSGQATTWLMGLLIFFDDYANSLLVGSSMRPISDRLRVSREKLAFLVDATAAPVASLAIISSWIGVEVGYIADQFEPLGIERDAYGVFLESIPYRFYPLLMLYFGILIVFMKRDFGPMYAAEMRARETGEVLAPGARPATDFDDEAAAQLGARPRWQNAVVPVLVVVVTALVGMYVTGVDGLEEGAGLREIFGNANSYYALLWSALLGSVTAVGLAVAGKDLDITEAMDAFLAGLKSMVLACTILVLAWSLGQICRELHTAQFLIEALGDWFAPALLPLVVFVLAAAVSFATGTSWGTMAILFPLVVPMAHHLAPDELGIMVGAISSILAGSVWGDHCSPISDTTILSSMASSCDHVDHVKTQLPYALLVGAVSMVVGELGTGYGLYPAWVGLLLGAAALTALVYFFGRPVPEHEPT